MIQPQSVVPQTLADYLMWGRITSLDHGRQTRWSIGPSSESFRGLSFYSSVSLSASPSSSFETKLP